MHWTQNQLRDFSPANYIGLGPPSYRPISLLRQGDAYAKAAKDAPTLYIRSMDGY